MQQLAAVPWHYCCMSLRLSACNSLRGIAGVFSYQAGGSCPGSLLLHEEVRPRDVAQHLVKDTCLQREPQRRVCFGYPAFLQKKSLPLHRHLSSGQSQLSLEDAIEVGLASGIRRNQHWPKSLLRSLVLRAMRHTRQFLLTKMPYQHKERPAFALYWISYLRLIQRYYARASRHAITTPIYYVNAKPHHKIAYCTTLRYQARF